MQAWLDFLKAQEHKRGEDVVQQWLRPLKISHFDSGNLYLEAIDSFQILWFEEHMRPDLRSQLLNSNGRPIKVHLTLGSAAPSSQRSPSRAKRATTPQIQLTPDPLHPLMTLQQFTASRSNAHLLRFFHELTGYNPSTERYETATIPLGSLNPIYLWGPTGSGKTHLLMALSQAFQAKGLHALYVRMETFTEHVVSAIRASEMQSFRKHYRQVDVLLIDDIHQLARKFATQEELFHTFNTLHTSGRQIILSSSCAPGLLEEIEPRLISRFEWGINLHFEPLQREDLQQALMKRSHHLGFPLSNELFSFLLDTFANSHSLYQALDTLILRCHLDGDEKQKTDSRCLTIIDAKQMLNALILQQQKTQLTPKKIYTAVASFYGICPEDLLGKSQTQECSFPRQIAMYLCRQELHLPFQSIGRCFGRDHSTVMTSIKQIENRIAEPDRELISSLIAIRRHLV